MSASPTLVDRAAVCLRRAEPRDLDAILAIRGALPMPTLQPGSDGGETRAGGFLLASDPELYRQLLAQARAWLLEIDGAAAGFCIALDDPTLRASPIWARRSQIEWSPGFDPDALVAGRVAYFDQIAVLPRIRARFYGAALALRALAELIDEAGHDAVLTTTVLEPIRNVAALPYLARVGARTVGRLAEVYPGIGPMVSAVHVIEAERYHAKVAATRVQPGPAARLLLELGRLP